MRTTSPASDSSIARERETLQATPVCATPLVDECKHKFSSNSSLERAATSSPTGTAPDASDLKRSTIGGLQFQQPTSLATVRQQQPSAVQPTLAPSLPTSSTTSQPSMQPDCPLPSTTMPSVVRLVGSLLGATRGSSDSVPLQMFSPSHSDTATTSSAPRSTSTASRYHTLQQRRNSPPGTQPQNRISANDKSVGEGIGGPTCSQDREQVTPCVPSEPAQAAPGETAVAPVAARVLLRSALGSPVSPPHPPNNATPPTHDSVQSGSLIASSVTPQQGTTSSANATPTVVPNSNRDNAKGNRCHPLLLLTALGRASDITASAVCAAASSTDKETARDASMPLTASTHAPTEPASGTSSAPQAHSSSTAEVTLALISAPPAATLPLLSTDKARSSLRLRLLGGKSPQSTSTEDTEGVRAVIAVPQTPPSSVTSSTPLASAVAHTGLSMQSSDPIAEQVSLPATATISPSSHSAPALSSLPPQPPPPLPPPPPQPQPHPQPKLADSWHGPFFGLPAAVGTLYEARGITALYGWQRECLAFSDVVEVCQSVSLSGWVDAAFRLLPWC